MTVLKAPETRPDLEPKFTDQRKLHILELCVLAISSRTIMSGQAVLMMMTMMMIGKIGFGRGRGVRLRLGLQGYNASTHLRHSRRASMDVSSLQGSTSSAAVEAVLPEARINSCHLLNKAVFAAGSGKWIPPSQIVIFGAPAKSTPHCVKSI